MNYNIWNAGFINTSGMGFNTSCFYNIKFNKAANINYTGARGGVVVKALGYKPAGRGLDSRCCHWNFSVT
jgi:hypothetical protein